MKIIFDHQIFSYERYGGISRYFSQLMKQFQAYKNCDFDLSLKYSDNIYIETLENIAVKPFLNNIHFNKKPGILNKLNLQNSKGHLKDQGYDIFHPTFYNPYFLRHLRHKPFVLTVHDMITEIFPGMFPGQAKISIWKRILIQKASKIIAVSENTKKDIIRICNINEKKIEVIYHGSSLDLVMCKDVNPTQLPEKYLLFVGKRSFYKNFDHFIKAISYLLTMDNQLYLICAGGTQFTTNEKRLFKNLEITDKVFHFHVDDPFLASLYKNALAFVLPSLYEGFGLPVLEAFSCGCPAIISKTSSLKEVGGSAVIYLDPEDESDIRESIRKVIYDKNLKNILRQEGFERARKFTWEQTALNTIKIYREVYE